MSASAPALSVVLVSLGDADALARATEAVATACQGMDAELVIPLPPHRVGRAGPARPGLEVRMVEVPAGGDNPWVLRAHGVRSARAPVIATLEDHALPEPGYGARVLAAHASHSHAAIGGVVAKAEPDGATGWAMYFLDYGRYIPPRFAGPVRWLSACNVTYKSGALQRVANAWTDDMHETTVHLALLEQGEEMWLDPALVVVQRRAQPFPAARDELRRHGAAFGRDLARHAGPLARAIRVLAAPLIPVVQVARAGSHLVRAPHHVPAFLRALPTLAVLAVAWADGEVRGLLGRPS